MVELATLVHRDPDVAAQIRDLQRAAYRVEADLIGFQQIPPLLEEAEDVQRLDVTFLGALDGEALLGLIGYRRLGTVVDIDRLAVDPRWFRRGLGRQLLAAVHEREDPERFEVSTGTANVPALALYRTAGYVPTRQQFDRVQTTRLTRFAASDGRA